MDQLHFITHPPSKATLKVYSAMDHEDSAVSNFMCQVTSRLCILGMISLLHVGQGNNVINWRTNSHGTGNVALRCVDFMEGAPGTGCRMAVECNSSGRYCPQSSAGGSSGCAGGALN